MPPLPRIPAPVLPHVSLPGLTFYSPLPTRALLIDGTFEGGGSLGAAYCGALLALARNGTWFKRIAGNSAGAITGSMIAAGYDANEIDFLFAPKGSRVGRPSNLPTTLAENEIRYADFMDVPTNAAEIASDSKRNSLIYMIVKGAAIDAIRNVRVPLPSTAEVADKVVAKVLEALPTQVGPFVWKVGPQQINVGPFNLPISNALKTTIRNAVQTALAAYPTSLSIAELGLGNTEALRATVADAALDQALNSSLLAREYYNLVGDGGLFKGDVFLAKMRKILGAKFPGTSVVKFKDLPIPLTVIASDWTNHRMIVYSSDDPQTREIEVAEAVRQSMSVPFVWEPRRGSDSQDRPIEIVDGGLSENWPIWVHLTAQTPEDLARPKIGFSLNSGKEAPAGNSCARSEYEGGADLLNAISGGGDPQRGAESQGLIEHRFLQRLMNWHATQGVPLHDSLATYYQTRPNVKLYPCDIPLAGFFWLDGIMSKKTFAAMACRGWEATLEVLTSNSAVTPATLVSTNPYK